MSPNIKTISETFKDYFEIVPADTEELKQEAYRLRYLVYCLETGFESANQFSDAMEHDAFDSHSLHYLIRHRRSGEYAATARMILPDPASLNGLLPIEAYCTIDNTAVTAAIDRSRLAEVSRFCVSKSFKRRKNEAHTLAGLNPDWKNDFFTTEERRSFPHISFGLIASVIRACHHLKIEHLYGSMETPWLRFLAASGIHFIKIGPLTDYHGERWPCAIKVSDLLASVAEKNPDLWRLLTNDGHF